MSIVIFMIILCINWTFYRFKLCFVLTYTILMRCYNMRINDNTKNQAKTGLTYKVCVCVCSKINIKNMFNNQQKYTNRTVYSEKDQFIHLMFQIICHSKYIVRLKFLNLTQSYHNLVLILNLVYKF